MIKLTDRAAEEVKTIIASKSLPESTMVRVEASPVEGKQEVRITLQLDNHGPRPDDVIESTGGTRVAVAEMAAQRLGDLRLDYSEDSGGFVIERPEARA